LPHHADRDVSILGIQTVMHEISNTLSVMGSITKLVEISAQEGILNCLIGHEQHASSSLSAESEHGASVHALDTQCQ